MVGASADEHVATAKRCRRRHAVRSRAPRVGRIRRGIQDRWPHPIETLPSPGAGRHSLAAQGRPRPADRRCDPLADARRRRLPAPVEILLRHLRLLDLEASGWFGGRRLVGRAAVFALGCSRDCYISTREGPDSCSDSAQNLLASDQMVGGSNPSGRAITAWGRASANPCWYAAGVSRAETKSRPATTTFS